MPEPLLRSLRASLAAFVVFFLLCAGTPGFSSLGSRPFTGKEGDRLRRQAGAAEPALSVALWLQQYVRHPMSRRLRLIERTFRIRQTWNLYPRGPKRSRSLEVLVDDRLVYRSNDRAHRWLADKLDHRRVRPINQTLVERDVALNWKPMMRYLRRNAERDFPEMTSLQVHAVWQNHRGGSLEPVIVHGRRVEAPDWALLSVGRDGVVTGEAE